MNEAKSIRKAYRPNLVVLVVEDHVVFAKDVKHALPDHTVVFANSLEVARTRYDESLPDVIFIDIDLPDGSGFEFIDYVHSREPDAYIAMLSGSKLQQDVDTSREKGVQHYIIKPLIRSKIELVIEEYLAKREQHMKSLMEATEKNRQEAVSPQEAGARSASGSSE